MAYIADAYETTPAPVPAKPAPLVKTRFTSIDSLKGLGILGVWLINAAGASPAIPAYLKPGPWGKPTIADCIFPALIFAIGLGLPLFAAFRKDHDSIGKFLIQTTSRAFWLILFGFVLDSVVARQPVFAVGALQLVGVAYFFNSLFARTPIVLRAFLAEGLLLAFYAWAKLNIVPGSMAGTFSESVNYIRYTNEHVLGPAGWRGLLALIPIVSIMMSGSVMGSLYLHDDSRFRRGLIFMGVGGTLIFFGWLWSLDHPMSAPIWTSSYALWTTGIATATLGVLNVAFDFEKGRQVAYPLLIPGTSIILALVGPVVLKTMILDVWSWPGTGETIDATFRSWIAATFTEPMSHWAYAIATVIVWWSILCATHLRREWLRKKCDSNL